MAYDPMNPYGLPLQGTWKPDKTQTNFLGSDFNTLKSLLNQQRGGDPKKDIYRKSFQKQLGKSSGRAIKNINEQTASSGFRGAGANLIGDVYESEAMATEGFENNLLQNDTQLAQSALAQLLQMNQFEGGQNFSKFQSDRQNSQFETGLNENRRQFDRRLAFDQENSGTDFWDVLSGILGTAGGVATGGLMGKWLS